MSYHFRPGKREGVQLLIGIAGPSAAGKTLSALLLAKGLSAGRPFAYVDTESGRALHYADDFDFLHTELDEPFSPSRYREVLAEAAKTSPPVIVIDSMTHEHSGPGGVLAMHEAELDRRAGDDFKMRDALNMSAWIKPKAERKLLIGDLLRVRCHLILCFRAEEKVDSVPDPAKPGKTKIVPKRTLAGHVGWIPVCGKEYPYELTLSLVVTPDQPGFPKPIKIMDQHRPLVPLDQSLSETTGRALAEWARGGTTDGLNKDAFAANLAAARIPHESVRDVGKELFPGKAASALTNAERGELWTALKDSGPTGTAQPTAERAEAPPHSPEVDRVLDHASAPPAEPEPGPAFTAPPESASDPDVLAANEAAEFVIPTGKWKGKTLREMLDAGDEGLGWIRWCLRHYETDPLKTKCWDFARVYCPDLYQEVMAQREAVA